MDFQFRLINRRTYPQKHLLIVEDTILQQKRFMEHFNNVLVNDDSSNIQISIVPGALAAAAIISSCKVDVIVLDHDLPEGSGSDLINWMKKNNHNIPIITASGIPYNNQHMINLGATYHFDKERVINGLADDLIKGLLTTNPSKVESYANTLCHNFISHRWWAHPQLLIGGSILNAADYQHLKSTYNIQSVINVETEHSDLDKDIENLCEQQVPDNGTPLPKAAIFNIIKFAEQALLKGNIYVHCQMGSSRSPAVAYAILRHCFKLSPDQALTQIADARPDPNRYGHHPYQQSYIKSVEEALLELNRTGIAEYYINTISPNNINLPRYWITPNILIGGNIVSQQDMDHLKNDFGVVAFINLDQRCDYSNMTDNVFQEYFPDNGDYISRELLHRAIEFGNKYINKPLYINCHLGMSRSPHIAYLILRHCYKLSQSEAIGKVIQALPTPRHQWGFNQHTVSYMKSIENVLLELK